MIVNIIEEDRIMYFLDNFIQECFDEIDRNKFNYGLSILLNYVPLFYFILVKDSGNFSLKDDDNFLVNYDIFYYEKYRKLLSKTLINNFSKLGRI